MQSLNFCLCQSLQFHSYYTHSIVHMHVQRAWKWKYNIIFSRSGCNIFHLRLRFCTVFFFFQGDVLCALREGSSPKLSEQMDVPFPQVSSPQVHFRRFLSAVSFPQVSIPQFPFRSFISAGFISAVFISAQEQGKVSEETWLGI